MVITVKLDVASIQLQDDGKDTTDKPMRCKSLKDKKKLRDDSVQRWLEETFEEGAWNGLGEARN